MNRNLKDVLAIQLIEDLVECRRRDECRSDADTNVCRCFVENEGCTLTARLNAGIVKELKDG